MARVIRNESRIELSRQLSYAINERATILTRLERRYPHGIPTSEHGKVGALTKKIQKLNTAVNGKLRRF